MMMWKRASSSMYGEKLSNAGLSRKKRSNENVVLIHWWKRGRAKENESIERTKEQQKHQNQTQQQQQQHNNNDNINKNKNKNNNNNNNRPSKKD